MARFGRDPAALAAAHVVPVRRRNAAARGAARDAHRRVVLLRAVYGVREVLVERHAVELRRRLIVDTAPRAPAIARDRRAPGIALDHPVRIVGRNPEAVSVTVRRTQGA